jgi:tripartite-type tricarboxylate transporter receptor subunit TctC
LRHTFATLLLNREKNPRVIQSLIFISVSLVTSAIAASVEEFYKGKTIQFIVGGSAGGGYDTYTRLIARYFAQYVPGKPSTVVQNMPGAAMLIAANYVFNSATERSSGIGPARSFYST